MNFGVNRNNAVTVFIVGFIAFSALIGLIVGIYYATRTHCTNSDAYKCLDLSCGSYTRQYKIAEEDYSSKTTSRLFGNENVSDSDVTDAYNTLLAAKEDLTKCICSQCPDCVKLDKITNTYC